MRPDRRAAERVANASAKRHRDSARGRGRNLSFSQRPHYYTGRRAAGRAIVFAIRAITTSRSRALTRGVRRMSVRAEPEAGRDPSAEAICDFPQPAHAIRSARATAGTSARTRGRDRLRRNARADREPATPRAPRVRGARRARARLARSAHVRVAVLSGRRRADLVRGSCACAASRSSARAAPRSRARSRARRRSPRASRGATRSCARLARGVVRRSPYRVARGQGPHRRGAPGRAARRAARALPRRRAPAAAAARARAVDHAPRARIRARCAPPARQGLRAGALARARSTGGAAAVRGRRRERPARARVHAAPTRRRDRGRTRTRRAPMRCSPVRARCAGSPSIVSPARGRSRDRRGRWRAAREREGASDTGPMTNGARSMSPNATCGV